VNLGRFWGKFDENLGKFMGKFWGNFGEKLGRKPSII
jgi:hypothetical protein